MARPGPDRAGIALVNRTELQVVLADPTRDVGAYARALLAVGRWPAGRGTPCTTPIGCARTRTAARAPGPRAGLATLPLAAIGYALVWGLDAVRGDPFAMPLSRGRRCSSA